MSGDKTLTIYTDGGARGNPGPAAFAYVIKSPDGTIIEQAGCLGKMTNNQAEYLALVRALEHGVRLGTDHHVRVLSDSELMVKQLNGEYRVKNEDLRELYQQAQKLRRQFASFQIRHIPRNQNSHADRLYNEALDGKQKLGKLRKPATEAAPDLNTEANNWLKEKAVDCLKKAALAWSRGDPNDPDPAAVLEKLWPLIEAYEQAE
ncbi:MAG: ribonuclease HI family protein [Gemmataceae bacterium]